jgi:hypothetical protein
MIAFDQARCDARKFGIQGQPIVQVLIFNSGIACAKTKRLPELAG